MSEPQSASQSRVDAFRHDAGWTAKDHPKHPRYVVLELLSRGVRVRYEKAGPFADVIKDVLYLPEYGDLNPQNRQRCLITLLATRAEHFALAIHTYFGLMEGINITEIRSILFVVGAYAGVPAMVNGIDLLERVLKIIDEFASNKQFDVPMMFQRLKDDFSPEAPTVQLVRALARTTKISEKDVGEILAEARAYLEATGTIEPTGNA